MRDEGAYPAVFSIPDGATELPDSWAWVPARAVFSERVQTGYQSEELLSVSLRTGVSRQASQTARKDTSSEDKSAYKLVLPGDIVYNKMRMWQGAVGVSRHRGIVSPAYVVLRPKIPVNEQYYGYLFKTPLYIREFNRLSYGLCDDQNSLRAVDFAQILLPLPPQSDQDTIVEWVQAVSGMLEVAAGVAGLGGEWRSDAMNLLTAKSFLSDSWPRLRTVFTRLGLRSVSDVVQSSLDVSERDLPELLAGLAANIEALRMTLLEEVLLGERDPQMSGDTDAT